MKKTSVRKKSKIKRIDMQAEYRFDYSKAKRNRFAAQMAGCTVTVVLEPDVAAVFKSSKAVNAFLRSVISAMPEPKHGRAG
jgi:hypothetical protein